MIVPADQFAIRARVALCKQWPQMLDFNQGAMFDILCQAFRETASITEAQNNKRVRDPLFHTLALVEGSEPLQLTAPAARKIAVALAAICRVAPGLTPREIEQRAKVYRALFPKCALTANALAMHWAKCGGSPAAIVQPLTEWERQKKNDRLADLKRELHDLNYPGGSAWRMELKGEKRERAEKIVEEMAVVRRELE